MTTTLNKPTNAASKKVSEVEPGTSKRPPVSVKPPKKKLKDRLSKVAQYAALFSVIAVFAVPIYWLFSNAFKPQGEIYQYPLQWIPHNLTWSNFVAAWESVPFDQYYMNSLIVTGVGTALEISIAILCAYAFSWVEFRWKTPVFLFLVGSMMLPGHITLIVNYITIGNLGWINTYQGIILPGIGSAFAMFLLYQQMRQVPRELIDAAKVDGAGHFRRLFYVVLPISKPMLLTATLIVLIGKWNEFIWPLIITTTQSMRTLPIGLVFLREDEGTVAWGTIMAATVLVSIPMLALFFLAQKKIIGGLAGGALKG